VAQAVSAAADELGTLDAVAGDGDHGIGMLRGTQAARQAADTAAAADAGVGTLLAGVGEAWSDKAGGTSGVLWGLVLAELGKAIGDTERPSLAALARGTEAACDAVAEFGGARTGDKTMLDVLAPVAAALRSAASADVPLAEAASRVARVASDAADATAGLMPRAGRARAHGANALGVPDPGAVSTALVIRTACTALLDASR
jgi:dihydroxyacetone kinase